MKAVQDSAPEGDHSTRYPVTLAVVVDACHAAHERRTAPGPDALAVRPAGAGGAGVNLTATPLPSSSGMCVAIDASLRGFPLRMTSSPSPSPLLAASGDTSTIWFPHRCNSVRSARPVSGPVSEIEFWAKCSSSRPVRLDRGDTSSTRLP